ncbi:glycine--tRNA ligase subunit beta [Candidatus Profftella armatura (Diaphorina cf. continua)]|uniref:Glycine--tRNA ligase beta subunit n=1 Tax=Candidatus Profftella armatura (Diaphorina cf. continua) TaxID=2661583 RepID=A0A7R6VZS5_9PROT|nr:glycine--tRNA ligase subunit beta [Candidatus Profftella armatura (Diaphorina cf. continua)]BCG49646.1 glycine--tRNA ligase subunit beta [Candidatus Profftella armatura (Diaphorina cf. continua)]
MNKILLVEFLTEELPSKILNKISNEFSNILYKILKKNNFLEKNSFAIPYATPRRLAVSITNVCSISHDKIIRKKILPVSLALNNISKAPTVLLKKKLSNLSKIIGIKLIKLNQLEKNIEKKVEFFFYNHIIKGILLKISLQKILEEVISKLPIPIIMNYQNFNNINNTQKIFCFIRPVRKLLILHGDNIIKINLFGLNSSNKTLGHRFLSKKIIKINSAEQYSDTLNKKGKVIANFQYRKKYIRNLLLKAAGKYKILMPEILLDEVTALVEWPIIHMCRFDKSFLTIPKECLILIMQKYQKYFALKDSNNLCSKFLIVSNLETNNPYFIIKGNEQVLHSRLLDANFFYEQDKKKKLIDRVPLLKNVIYHNKLGNQFERTLRICKISIKISNLLNENSKLVERAAFLSKSDLLTSMVIEFPELQGIIGGYYAYNDGESIEIIKSIKEHYKPCFSGDTLPKNIISIILALSDKLETLVGIWGIGLKPTGDKDPFALRRCTMGILRILIEKNIPLSILELLNNTVNIFKKNIHFNNPTKELLKFIYDRLYTLLNKKKYKFNEIQAIIKKKPDIISNINDKIIAIHSFILLPESKKILSINKRIHNIFKNIDSSFLKNKKIQYELFKKTEEINLYIIIKKIEPKINILYSKGEFFKILKLLIKLYDSTNIYFEKVQIITQDILLKTNRLILIKKLYKLLNIIADLSKLIQ